MLKNLIIQNLAIAENVSVTFSPGLNVITGETGAGKSLLVDALCLLRGGRVDLSLIRTGHDQSIICGLFSVDTNDDALIILRESGVLLSHEAVDDILIKRIICKNGKHRQLINDIPVTLKTLQTVANKLIDISSQFDNQRLLDAEFHASFLDEYSQCYELYNIYREKFETVQKLSKEVQELLYEQSLLLREKNLFEFEREQIESAQLCEEEFERIENLLEQGQKSQQAKRIITEVLNLLSESDINVLSILKQTKKNTERLLKYDKTSSEVASCIESIQDIVLNVEDVSKRMENIFRTFDVDDNLFKDAEERIETYNKILQKFGPTLQHVFSYKEKCDAFLEKTLSISDRINNLIQKTTEIIYECINLAKKLSFVRQENLQSISGCIEKELSDLGMNKSRFICMLQPNEKSHHSTPFLNKLPSDVLEEFMHLNKQGFEKAQFLLSANLGQDLQPIEKVASGGELSRIMLAIKNVLFGNDDMSVFVFDEIDSGISGSIAAKVGKKLLQFCDSSLNGAKRQAICITHLPQVASYAHQHFVALKIVDNNKTVTQIVCADFEMRVQEIAAMLSGERITIESIEQARSLMRGIEH